MFPLGSVLFPGMPLPLRVFEPRYVEMMSVVLGRTPSEFAVVLIERGSEVGGGDVRFPLGTVAAIETVQIGEGSIQLMARGGARVEVVEWLADDPYPRARLRELPPLAAGTVDPAALAGAEQVVRETLSRVSEFAEPRWPADIELSDDPDTRIWQLAGIAPIGPLDQQALLASASAGDLLARLVEETRAAAETLVQGWTDPEDGLD